MKRQRKENDMSLTKQDREMAMRAAQMAEEAIVDAYRCPDPYELAGAPEPTLGEMLSIDENNLKHN